MFKSTQNKGFSITFQNGLTISVQFGVGNYCNRRNFEADFRSEMNTAIVESLDAEIAIRDEENNWFNFGTDTVKGWVSADEVGTWIGKVMAATSLQDIRQV